MIEPTRAVAIFSGRRANFLVILISDQSHGSNLVPIYMQGTRIDTSQ